jgi:hypothetical protein
VPEPNDTRNGFSLTGPKKEGAKPWPGVRSLIVGLPTMSF